MAENRTPDPKPCRQFKQSYEYGEPVDYCHVCGATYEQHRTPETSDTERLDFIERYLCREGEIRNDQGNDPVPVRSWSVVTASTGTLRETIDLMMKQRTRLTHG